MLVCIKPKQLVLFAWRTVPTVSSEPLTDLKSTNTIIPIMISRGDLLNFGLSLVHANLKGDMSDLSAPHYFANIRFKKYEMFSCLHPQQINNLKH